jgi:hypothetical protein
MNRSLSLGPRVGKVLPPDICSGGRCVELRCGEARSAALRGAAKRSRVAIDRKRRSPPKRAGVWPPIRCSSLEKD